MIKRLVLIASLAVMVVIGVSTARAAVPVQVYVDTSYTGTEDGTQAHPYNTRQEGVAFAQAQPGGGWVYLKQADGTWGTPFYVSPVVSGATGVPLPEATLYALLGALSLGLLLSGWLLRRRARRLKG